MRTQHRLALPPLPPAWQEALDDWEAWMRSAGRPATTIGLRVYQMHRAGLAVLPTGPWGVTTDVVTRWLAGFDWSPETRRSYRSALRSFYRWAEMTHRVAKDPTITLPTVPIPPGVAKPAPEFVIKTALAAADRRVRAMILLGAICGLRRGEIAQLHTVDLLPGDQLRVHGKGRRARIVPLPPIVVQALAGLPRGYCFPGQVDGHLSAAHVGKLLSRALGPDWSGHALRHRCASVAYSAQRDLRAVQALLGHSRPETTVRYTAVPDGALRTAVSATATIG